MENKTKEKKIYKKIKRIVLIIFYILATIILISLSAQKISNNAISIAGYRIFRIASESMIPKYEIGDVILVKELPFDEIKEGDDVVYVANRGDATGLPIAHTLIKKEIGEDGMYYFYTQGIANMNMDAVVYQNQVLGIVKSKLFITSLLCRFVNQLYGAIIVIFIPLIIIIIVESKELITNIKKEKNKSKE